MTVLSCENVSLSFGVKDILKNISFSVEESDKLGIIGVNGAGKTSLIRIITKEINLDGADVNYSGGIYLSKNAEIGTLNQSFTEEDEETTVYNYIKTAFAKLEQKEKQIAETEEKMANLNASDESAMAEIQRLLDLHDRLLTEFETGGGYTFEGRMKSALLALGFEESDFDKKIRLLSGGQKTRVGLIRLFLNEPDILILDEPTNHIDSDSIEWLEDFLKNYRKTVIMISHDRYFLDNVTNKILELENTGSKMYGGNYSQYVVKKQNDREIQQHHYAMQQREIARIEAIIEQQRRWGREKNIKTAESKQKQIDRMEKIDKPENLPDKIKLSFGGRKDVFYESGNDVLSIKLLSKSYPNKRLFQNLSVEIKKKDHFFIIGKNGTGKSTLLKIITGSVSPDIGTYEWGYNTKIGYYDQEHQNLDENSTVLDEIWNEFGDMTQTELRTALAAFLFKEDDVKKEIKALSGGERARLTIMKLILRKPNILVLDEPTNHLDINSREALEKSLEDFKGTVISVSHDRYFIKKLSTRILELHTDGTFMDFKLNYDDYQLYKSRQNNSVEKEQSPKEAKPDSRTDAKKQEKIERQTQNTEAEISQKEEKIKLLKDSLHDDDISSDYVRINEIYEEIDAVESEISSLYEKLAALEE